ncbi:MAG TPA: hypothetical protein VN176_13900 [Verrucomicrobiae bacterium]|jgi:hypothetical protein|nr:hypothetical protein [Verrucomicrobiae bacterium]
MSEILPKAMGRIRIPKMSPQLQPAELAVQFLVSRIEEQAARDGVPLSDVERQMLYHSESSEQTVDATTTKKFESEYDSDAYETKIARLLRNVYKRDAKLGQKRAWRDALKTLRREDRYVLVMVQQAGIKGLELGSSDRKAVLPLMIFAVIGFIMILAAFRLNWIQGYLLQGVVFFSFIALLWGLGELIGQLRSDK